MKKVIALALVLAMALSMVAMADPVDVEVDAGPSSCGHNIKVDRLLPGEKYHFSVVNLPDSLPLNSSNYSISADWKVGSHLVQSTKIEKCEGEYVVEVKIKENYTIDELKELRGTITLTSKKLATGDAAVVGKETKVTYTVGGTILATDTATVGGETSDAAGGTTAADLAGKVRDKLTATFTDGNGVEWAVSGSGAEVILTSSEKGDFAAPAASATNDATITPVVEQGEDPAPAGEDTKKGYKYKINFTGDNADNSVFEAGKTTLWVSNYTEDIDGADNKDDATEIDVADNTIYEVNTAGWFEFAGSSRTGSFKVRLPEDKKIFAFFDEDPIEAIEDKYYDLDTDLEYFNFVAKPNLGRNADVALQGDYSSKYHLYEYNNGKLKEIDAKWNDDDGQFEFKTSQLTSYVISEKALIEETLDETPDDEKDTTTSDKNPDTGANDVVGVAVALAVVSLVAAGAVSLKK